ncbi:MAG: hypothetical protein JO115_11765 [Pseudonocardiales bacterium]|nr:hypothetical protein [Pseudonocardiales bacterium]
MIKHAKHDDEERYEGNGHDPNRPIPPEKPGGKHRKPNKDDEEDQDT